MCYNEGHKQEEKGASRMFWWFAALAVLGLLLLWAVLPGRPSAAQRAMLQNWHVAHRGLHTADKTTPENSMPAFLAAGAAGYGIELDVQLSRDGEVLVFHDDTLDRVTGASGRLDARDWAELRTLRLCGSEEGIPRFETLLEKLAAQGSAGPLIVELKTGPRNPLLCQKTLALLRGYPGSYCIESFDPRILAWFRRHAPEVLRGQLTQPYAEFRTGGLPVVRAFALSRCLGNFAARPQFIAWGPGPKNLPKNLLIRLAEGFGALRVRWTVRDTDIPALEALHAGYDALIFEFFTPGPRW